MTYLILALMVFQPGQAAPPPPHHIVKDFIIPAYGNSWVTSDWHRNKEVISEDGIKNWSSPDDVIRTYFHTDYTGEIHLSIQGLVPEGESRIQIDCGGTSYGVEISSSGDGMIDVGAFRITQPGYQYFELKGIHKTGEYYADIQAFVVNGPVSENRLTYVKEDFYWGRRGPSVHLNYQMPENKDIEWYYNEITVPEGEDIVGSYFMACGFGEGYFGMQVNSEDERRILFSVWSPYKTQNPEEIPEGYRILLQEKGEGVHTGEFGNEGSGGQSYWRYGWKSGQTYRFLLKTIPVENNSTDYTAWFYAPELREWKLIASFRRPHTHTYLTRPHSFLENFYTQTGYLERKGFYTNQWVRDKAGNWYEMTRAKFTADATARKGSRLDYSGGVEDGKFFMKNCGFINQSTPIDSWFERPATGIKPNVNLVKLSD